MSESTATRPSRALPATIVALLAVNLGAMTWLVRESHGMRTETNTRMTAVERTLRLLRMELTTPLEGKGFLALMEHLEFWAPWLGKAKPGTSDRFFVDERVDEIVETMSFLPDAYAQIEAAFLSVNANAGDSTAGDEVRRFLLIAAHAADPQKGVDLLARVLEHKDLEISLHLRRFAASELFQADKARAGAIIHELLMAAIKRGAPGRPGGQSGDLHRQQVFNYIDDYVASGHADIEKTLIKFLQTTEYHTPITIQRCVEALGRMKSRAAVSRIKTLFWQQAPVPGQIPNPIFRRKCMMAVVEAIGAEAVPFLKEIDRRESDTGIRARLNEYKKEFDFSK